MKWKIINDNYLDFLRNNYDNRIPKTNYGSNCLKPFFGELFRVDDLVYVTQVSSAELYDLKSEEPQHKISLRCFDFKKLENAAGDWIIKSNKLNSTELKI